VHSALRHSTALLLKRRPVHLTFFVTARCHLRCPFCFYAEARDAPAPAPELDLVEIAKVARSTGPLLWLALGGGEPFLRKDLAEIAGAFHDACRPAFLTIPTGGTLPEVVADRAAEILRRCPGSAVVLKLSLDGVGRRHDALRRAPGSFEKVLETQRRLVRLAAGEPRLEVGVSTLFAPENQRFMDEIVAFVHGLEGIRSHTLTMIRGPGREAVDLAAYRRAARALERLWGAREEHRHRFDGARLKAAQDRLQRELIHETLRARRRVVPCQAGRLSLVLSEAGELRACEERPERSLGNVRDAAYDVRAMLRSDRARDVRSEIAAGGCFCTHECNFVTNVLSSPRRWPSLARAWGRLALGLAPAEGPTEGPSPGQGAAPGEAERRWEGGRAAWGGRRW